MENDGEFEICKKKRHISQSFSIDELLKADNLDYRICLDLIQCDMKSF